MSQLKSDSPGDPKAWTLFVTGCSLLLLIMVIWSLAMLLLGCRVEMPEDIVDEWEPSAIGTLILLGIETLLAFALLPIAIRSGEPSASRRTARWGLLACLAGTAVAFAEHAIVSLRVWGHLKLF